MSKGSTPRPVNKPRYDRNHDAIRWKSKGYTLDQGKAWRNIGTRVIRGMKKSLP